MVLAAALLAACTTLTALESAIHPAPPVDPRTQMPALEQRIYELVEAEREKIDPKAKKLVLDAELAGIARDRSDDMAAKHYMAHTAPDGETSASLIMAKDANFQGLLGENIAAQYYTKSSGIDVDTYAKRFVDTWLASKSHRDNLAFAEYDHTGVGAAVNGDTVYVTQLFSTDLGLKAPPATPGGAAAPARQQGDARKVSEFSTPQAAKKSEPEKRDVRLRGAMGVDEEN